VSFDYSSLKSTADRLIARFGKTATLVRLEQSGTDFDPTTVEIEFDVTLVELEFSKMVRDGTLVQQGDKRLLVSTAGETPTQADRIRLDDIDYEIVQSDPLNPGGTVLMFEIQARA